MQQLHLEHTSQSARAPAGSRHRRQGAVAAPTDINTDPPDIRINVFYHQTYTAKTARREQPAAEGHRGRGVAKEARGVAKPEAQRLDARVQNIGRG